MGDQQQTINALREALTRIEKRDPNEPVPDFLDTSKPLEPMPEDEEPELAEGGGDLAPAGLPGSGAGTASTGTSSADAGRGEIAGEVEAPFVAEPDLEAERSEIASSQPASSETEGPEPDSPEPLSPEKQYEKAKAVVLRRLTGSPKSRHQLAVALKEKEFSDDVITRVLDRMEEVHLVNDAEFARTWVRGRHEIKNLGKSALRRELREKGISEPLAEEALEQLSDDDEHAAARELVERKLRGKSVPVGNGPEERGERDKLTRRLVSMLARRGHSPGAAFQIVRDVMDERSNA